jgi:hypothetical protein
MVNITGVGKMSNFDGCQLPGVPGLSEGPANVGPQPLVRRVKRLLAKPWNYHVKKWLKQGYYWWKKNTKANGKAAPAPAAKATPAVVAIQTGDWVRVRSREEIQTTLDPFKELRGCAFLPDMYQYCGSTHRVLVRMERFLDERDYKVKKTRGMILLEGVLCYGTPAFGRCDRRCHLFWREEWLEKIEQPVSETVQAQKVD